jgi:hypothetical protein
MPMSPFSGETTSSGLPGVYGAVISGHRESSAVRDLRRNEAPEATGDDTKPITRNEVVPGSSPGVGFWICREKLPT